MAALLAFTEAPGGTRDIWVLRFSDRQAQPFLQTPAIEGGAQFSPDGRWMAYVSDESGRPEIYVQAYPGPGGKWQVSTERGQEPVWIANGWELFYRSGNRMMAVDIATRPSFTAGRPRMLFDRPYVSIELPETIPVDDVSPDGQPFPMVEEGERADAPPVEVVVNWPEDLGVGCPQVADSELSNDSTSSDQRISLISLGLPLLARRRLRLEVDVDRRIRIDDHALLLTADARKLLIGLQHGACLAVVENQRPKLRRGDVRWQVKLVVLRPIERLLARVDDATA